MLRRLAHLALTLALVLAGLTAGRCASRFCTVAQADEMECCRIKAGIHAPSCCPDGTQLSRQTAPAAVKRQAVGGVSLAAAYAAPLPLRAEHDRPVPTSWHIDPGAAPPDTLVTHRTSLLL